MRVNRGFRTSGVGALALLLAACSGSIPGGREGEGGSGGGGAGGSSKAGRGAGSDGAGGVAPINSNEGTLLPEAKDCDRAQVGLAPARRLTNEEYDRTVRDLFPGIDVGKPSLDASFPSDYTFRHLFSNNSDHQGIVSELAIGYLEAAQKLTAKLAPKLTTVLGCDPASGDACIKSFIGSFGKRAFRRPLTTAESDSFASFYAAQKTALGNPSEAAFAVIERFLTSTQFLHRYEAFTAAPSGGAPARVDPWAMASRIAYLVTGTMPDAQLFAAAESGALAKDDEIRKQVDRLLGSPDARPTVRRFMTEWLELFRAQGQMRDAKLFPGYSADVASAMREQAERTAEEQFFAADGWKNLVSGNSTFMNKTLADYYGITGPTGTSFQPVSVDATRAAGVLTSGAIMTFTSKDKQPSVIYRGKWVRERLLCWDPPEVPLGVPQFPIDGAKTNRELTEMHSKNPACAACHKLMDPIGFGFEHYDAAGKWRDQDNGQAIDDAGELSMAGASSGPIKGAAELGKRLADSSIARECIALRWFQNAVGREPDPERDACSLRQVADALAASGSLKDALVAFVKSSAFLYGRAD